jgi:hypothetical protein
MALKETQRSIRIYFGLVGALALLGGLYDINELSRLHGFTIPFTWTLAIYLPLAGHIILGIAYLVLAVQLPRDLVMGARWAPRLLVATVIFLVFDAALTTAVFGFALAQREVVRSLLGLAICVYLFNSIRRLSEEARVQAGVPPEPPAARVIND